ncbi:MAG: TIGR03118 family protein [Acidobacteria bacterium]|nr:TIGR03118 family protein [Acidobacteriota bacterium]
MLNIRDRRGAALPLAAFAGVLGIAIAAPAQQLQHYKQTNLVSDTTNDPNLVNGWGMSRSSGSPWWISDNGTGKTTLYSGTGSIVPLVVTIPSGDAKKNPTGTPTGQVFNGTTDFELAPTKPAVFIFATEDGTISAWNPGVAPTDAVIKVNTKGSAVFKGLAMATIRDAKGGGIANFLYAADFKQGRIRVYDKFFNPISLGGDAFRDDHVRHGFAPFNIQNIGGNLYVAYAKQDSQKHDEIAGMGLGYVDVYTPWGHLIHRLQHGWWLNAPWGMAQAPSDFGAFSHDILVGQFGTGKIAVFDPVTGDFIGHLNDASNKPIAIEGLWAIAFGSGGTSGPANNLFFAAGPDDESHGLFGFIAPVENVLGGDQ